MHVLMCIINTTLGHYVVYMKMFVVIMECHLRVCVSVCIFVLCVYDVDYDGGKKK